MNILVTGGSGFFGQAFCKAIEKHATKVIVYSRGEVKQAEMRQEWNPEVARYFIGDVRDLQRLTRAMRGVDVVIHAAALKRIEVGAYNPDEMVKTNINGTQNVIEAAIDQYVGKVIFLSSDKAYAPISPYGQSKALAESLILNANNISGGRTRFAVTRYGNVAGSTGSVIPIWKKQIDRGEKVIVTDPDCTRFWMSKEQAVELVYSTMRTMVGGELNIPTLPAYRLGDLCEAMEGQPVIIGLPEHEKKHESMSTDISSDTARRMTVAEIKYQLSQI